MTNGNVHIVEFSTWNDSRTVTWDQFPVDEPEVSPRGGRTPAGGTTPADAGGDVADGSFVLVPLGAQATFGGILYGTMAVTNRGTYSITNGLRLHEQSSLVNMGAITGDELRLSDQSFLTNAGTIHLDWLQLDTVAGDAVAVCNSGQMHVAELVLNKEGAGEIESGPTGLIEISAAWLGQSLIAPFTLTNGQSLTLGGVSFTTHGSGIIRVAFPPLTLVSSASSGTNFCFSFQTVTNVSYTVEFNDDLRTTNWLFHHTMTGNGALMPCLIPRTNSTQRFFRARQP